TAASSSATRASRASKCPSLTMTANMLSGVQPRARLSLIQSCQVGGRLASAVAMTMNFLLMGPGQTALAQQLGRARYAKGSVVQEIQALRNRAPPRGRA